MKQGYLSQYFDGAAAKHLSAVEADTFRSHQHELNGVDGLKQILGEPDGKVRYPARFLYLADNEDRCLGDEAWLTWYDARQKARLERGVMRWEYRLYFPDNAALQAAQAGDLLVVAKNRDESLLAIVAEKDSTAARQLLWMFGFDENLESGLAVRTEEEIEHDQLGFAERFILDQIGIEVIDEAPDDLELILERFGAKFPPTTEFSAFVRSLLPDVTGREDPDAALLAWMEREERLYRTLERHLLVESLDDLLQKQDRKALDPEPFIKVVQSTLQRRKSRAGFALENHLEQVFQVHGITYTRTGVTEGRLKPDFIFPDIARYHDFQFPESGLTMLAAKTTCKDRWRQILNEAARIPYKHLITTEPGISENQTEEMSAEKVQLVIPKGLHGSYTPAQQKWIIPLAEFNRIVKARRPQPARS